MVKNTLTERAAQEAGITAFDGHFQGPSAIAFVTGDPVEAAKGLRDFAKANPLLVIKAGVLDGKPLTTEEITKLADLESREVLLAKMAGAMKGSLTKAAYLFAAPLRRRPVWSTPCVRSARRRAPPRRLRPPRQPPTSPRVATRADALLASVRFINQPLTASNRKEAIMAKLSTDELLDAFKEMTLIELSEFVKQFEETFEVTAAAPVAVAAAGGAAGGAAAEEAEEQSEFDVVLTAAGEKKIQVIKEVRALTSLGLKEAKDLVDGAPKPVLEKVDKASADKAKEQLEAAGASVELK